jgi:hypothetical protein
MSNASAQRTDYSSKSGEGKVTSSSKMTDTIKGGGSGAGSGPTGSSQSYPKKVGSRPHNTDFNPQKCPATDLYVGGV